MFIIRAALGEGYNGAIAFADALESFGGGQDDPVSVSIGGCWELYIYIYVVSLFIKKKETKKCFSFDVMK